MSAGPHTSAHLRGIVLMDNTTKLKAWKRQSNYMGKDWTGWLVAPCGRHRDSDSVERANWESQIERIPESETVQIVRERHWAVGWVEWLAIRPEDRAVVEAAERIAEEIEGYPVLDDDRLARIEVEDETDDDDDEDDDE